MEKIYKVFKDDKGIIKQYDDENLNLIFQGEIIKRGNKWPRKRVL